MGFVTEIKVSPADNSTLIFIGSHQINWKSQDCGENVAAMNQGNNIFYNKIARIY